MRDPLRRHPEGIAGDNGPDRFVGRGGLELGRPICAILNDRIDIRLAGATAEGEQN